MRYNILMRLDRLLANSGLGTRSQVRDKISKGSVLVNGAVITDASFHVSENDSIIYDGEPINCQTKLYYLLDKPDGVLTAMEDKRLPCVADYIPSELMSKKLSPVGRLDYHTSGLLIITNDGELSHRLQSPKYEVPKIYLARSTLLHSEALHGPKKRSPRLQKGSPLGIKAMLSRSLRLT